MKKKGERGVSWRIERITIREIAKIRLNGFLPTPSLGCWKIAKWELPSTHEFAKTWKANWVLCELIVHYYSGDGINRLWMSKGTLALRQHWCWVCGEEMKLALCQYSMYVWSFLVGMTIEWEAYIISGLYSRKLVAWSVSAARRKLNFTVGYSSWQSYYSADCNSRYGCLRIFFLRRNYSVMLVVAVLLTAVAMMATATVMVVVITTMVMIMLFSVLLELLKLFWYRIEFYKVYF